MKKPMWPLNWIPPKDRRVPWYEYPNDIETGLADTSKWSGTDTFSNLPKLYQHVHRTRTQNMDVSWLTKTIEFFQQVTTDPFKACRTN